MSDAVEVRKAMGRKFSAHPPIKAKIADCDILLRSRISVGDAERILPILGEFADNKSSLGEVCTKLFEVLAQGTDGKPLVEPGEDEWFQNVGDSGEIIQVIQGSGLLQKVLDAFAPGDGDVADEGKPKA